MTSTPPVVALFGSLGHGKTSLFKKLCGEDPTYARSSHAPEMQIKRSVQHGILVINIPGFASLEHAEQHIAWQRAILADNRLSGVYIVVKYAKADEIAEFVGRVMDSLNDEDVRVIVTHAEDFRYHLGFDKDAMMEKLVSMLGVPKSNIAIVGNDTSTLEIENFIAKTLHQPKLFLMNARQVAEVEKFSFGASRANKAIADTKQKLEGATELIREVLCRCVAMEGGKACIYVLHEATKGLMESKYAELVSSFTAELTPQQRQMHGSKLTVEFSLQWEKFLAMSNSTLAELQRNQGQPMSAMQPGNTNTAYGFPKNVGGIKPVDCEPPSQDNSSSVRMPCPNCKEDFDCPAGLAKLVKTSDSIVIARDEASNNVRNEGATSQYVLQRNSGPVPATTTAGNVETAKPITNSSRQSATSGNSPNTYTNIRTASGTNQIHRGVDPNTEKYERVEKHKDTRHDFQATKDANGSSSAFRTQPSPKRAPEPGGFTENYKGVENYHGSTAEVQAKNANGSSSTVRVQLSPNHATESHDDFDRHNHRQGQQEKRGSSHGENQKTGVWNTPGTTVQDHSQLQGLNRAQRMEKTSPDPPVVSHSSPNPMQHEKYLGSQNHRQVKTAGVPQQHGSLASAVNGPPNGHATPRNASTDAVFRRQPNQAGHSPARQQHSTGKPQGHHVNESTINDKYEQERTGTDRLQEHSRDQGQSSGGMNKGWGDSFETRFKKSEAENSRALLEAFAAMTASQKK